MASVEMRRFRCGSNGWEDAGTVRFMRMSRWITVQHNYNPSKRNQLWDYVTDGYGYRPGQKEFNPENGLYLDYFKWNGRTWAVEQFLAYGNPFWNPETYFWTDKDGKLSHLSGVDMDNYYSPISVEFDEYCERVRVYERERD